MTYPALALRLLLPGLLLMVITQAQAQSGSAQDVAMSEHEHALLPTDSELTLKSVVEAAVNRAPEQRLSQTLQQIATDQQSVSERWISGMPRFNLSYWDDQMFDNTGFKETEMGLEFDLWRWDEKSSASALASDQQQLFQAWKGYLHWMMAGKVRQQLHKMAIADAEILQAKQNVINTQQLLKISRQRFQAGELPERAVLQSEALLLQARQQLLTASAEQVDGQRRYQQLTDLKRRPEVIAETPPISDEITANHPVVLYRLAQRQQQMSLLNRQRYQASGNTTLSIGLRRDQGSDEESPIDSVGLAITIPFGSTNNSHSRASTASTATAIAEADVQLLNTRRELQQQLHEIEHELRLQQDALGYARTSADLHRRQWQMALRAFELGESDLEPAILAQKQYQQSQQQFQLQKLRQQALQASYRQVVGELP